jgi:pilus assembly protein Flp/PilA
MLFHSKEQGQGMVEYALIIVLVCIVVVALIVVMGTSVSHMYSEITAAFPVR